MSIFNSKLQRLERKLVGHKLMMLEMVGTLTDKSEG